MNNYQTLVAQKLHKAYLRSGLTPEQFYNHILETRGHLIVATRPETLYFKIQVEEYGFDLEWFYWDSKSQLWLEG